MPEPITKTLADLDPAALPLAGTELTFVMQGGEPKRTPVSSIGGGASANTYSHSGTYTPTVTTNGEATVAPALLSGYSRVGNGAGVPLAGDTVTVFGAFAAEGLADGDVVLVSLPFQIAENVYPWCDGTIIPGSGIDVTSAFAFSGPDGAFAFTMGVSGLGDGGVSFTFTYQTANAVDP